MRPQPPDHTSGALAGEATPGGREYHKYQNGLSVIPWLLRMSADAVRRPRIRGRAAMFLRQEAAKKPLDCGCGMGKESMDFAKQGAEVTAMGISPAGIELTLRRVAHTGLAGWLQVHVKGAQAPVQQLCRGSGV
jgi:hypothetical protein